MQNLMKTTRWQTTRLILLAAITMGVVAVLIRVFLLPAAKTDSKLAQSNTFEFPNSVPLTGWEPISNQALKAQKKAQSDGHLYQYRQNNQTLVVEVRHELYGGANVSRLLNIYTPIPPATVLINVREKPETGFYGIFEHENKAYLTACINPEGRSTVTEQQFVQNKYKYGWGVGRTFGWMLGQNDLFEASCLWTLASLPVNSEANPAALEQTYQTLATVWGEWYQWWKEKL